MVSLKDYAAASLNIYDKDYVNVPTTLTVTLKSHKANSCFWVFESATDKIIVFEGTNDSDGAKDWLNDFDVLKIHASKITPLYDSNIKIHKGFWDNYSNLRESIHEVICASTEKKLSLCGHSMGAADALLCRADVLDNFKIDLPVVTFGCPSVGNKAFYDYVMSSEIKLFKNNNDLVTNVPFQWLGYYHPKYTQVSGNTPSFKGWTPFGNINDHSPLNYYKAMGSFC